MGTGPSAGETARPEANADRPPLEAGISADAVNISLHDDVLTISGEVPQFTLENSRALLLERNHGKFQRSIRLPQTVDVNAVEAQIENGVLTLTLPKSPEAQPRVIPVKAGSSFSNN